MNIVVVSAGFIEHTIGLETKGQETKNRISAISLLMTGSR